MGALFLKIKKRLDIIFHDFKIDLKYFYLLIFSVHSYLIYQYKS